MGWREIRANSRDIVHATFARPAVYITKQGVRTNVLARLHNKLEVFGDLDREGYAKLFEEVNQVVFDSTEIVPRKGDVVDFGVDEFFVPVANGEEKYTITGITPAAGDRYIRTDVTLELGS